MLKQQLENEMVCVYNTSAQCRHVLSVASDFTLARERAYRSFVVVLYEYDNHIQIK